MSDITNQPKSTKMIRVGVSLWKEKRAEIASLRTENNRLTQQLAETETANRVLTMAANELAKVRRERDEYAEKFTTLYHFQATYDESKRCWDLVARSNDALTAERDQLRKQLAAANNRVRDWRETAENYMQHCSKACEQLAATEAKLELATLSLSKREPEPLTETRTK